MIDTGGRPMKAMRLLAINCGFGNNDWGTLPLSVQCRRRVPLQFPRGFVTLPQS
jgi:hypothetical protein